MEAYAASQHVGGHWGRPMRLRRWSPDIVGGLCGPDADNVFSICTITTRLPDDSLTFVAAKFGAEPRTDYSNAVHDTPNAR